MTVRLVGKPIPPVILGRPNPKPAVPPNGFTGNSQQTPANVGLLSQPVSLAPWMGTPTSRRRRRKRRKSKRKSTRSSRRTRRTRRTRSSRPARLVKGSAAAKRYMAKLRRMRKKR